MIDLSELFPVRLSGPVTLQQAIPNIAFVTLGKHGNYQGRIDNAALEPSPTLCKTGLPSYKHVVTELGKQPPKPSQLKKQRWKKTKQGSNHKDRFSLSRLACPRPAGTIQKTATGSSGTMHPDEPRELYEFELKRIGSYPDQVEFSGNWSDILGRIGNSVPPLFMKAIATQIRHKIWGGVELKPYPKTMDYKAILDEAWQQHLAPKDPDAPTVISTFAGGGGSSLGYSMAGYRELLAVEWDNNAVETFKLNFPDVPVYHGDIAKLSVDECMRLAGLSEPGELDLLDGSPPCQGFSTAGKRILNDPRNQLFREYIRLLRGLKPKVFVMENVSGMVKGKMKLVFAEVMKELKASGYKVSCRLMNAMYFYVPQSRQRLIFIGVREDLGVEPGYPIKKGVPITVGEAIGDLEMKRPELSLNNLNNWDGRENGRFSSVRVMVNKPCPTLTKTQKPHATTGLNHYLFPQSLSIDELKRLQSFPDMFITKGKYSTQSARIGNSVPPLFMRSIANHIKGNILAQKPVLIES